VLLTIIFVWLLGYLDTHGFIGLIGGGGVVAVTAWVDDRHGISTLGRGLVYLLASTWVVFWIVGMSESSGITHISFYLAAILAITWLTNLYNFMDGSDGLAATQAVCTGIIITVLLFMLNQTGNAFISASLTASALGFLMWNWPPAKIFMGDVGSCLIGFIYAALALSSILQSDSMLAIWFIVLSVFICDATLTLFKRIISREKWYRAHRQHAYQKLIQMGFLHKQVNYFVIIINLCMLFPAVLFVWIFPTFQWWTTVTIYTLLAGIWLYVQIKYRYYANRAGIND
jgi:Fuc2NAc and GlcNAc transferase